MFRSSLLLGFGLIVAIVAASTAYFWFRGTPRRVESPVIAGNPTPIAKPKPPTETKLAESARQLIWLAEQEVLHIGSKQVATLKAAIRDRHAGRIAALLAGDFRGRPLTSEPEQSEHGGITFHARSGVGRNPRDASGAEFVAWLLEQLAPFAGSPSVEVRVVKLSPAERDEPNGRWRGTWVLRGFGNLTDGRRGELVLTGGFECDRPSTADPQRPWLHAWRVDRTKFSFADHALMEDVTARTGINVGALHDNWKFVRSRFVATPGGVFACDFNRDGHTDLLISDPNAPMLYRGLGNGQFEDVTIDCGIPWDQPMLLAICFADLDNDSDEDLVFGRTLLENRDGRFVARGRFPMTETAIGLAVADYDRDGRVDLYVSCMAPPPITDEQVSWVDDQSGQPNQLWRNLGDFRFEDVTDSANAAAGRRSTFTSVWLDADDDGWPDLYVINELGPNVLLRNRQNGVFEEQHIGPAFDGFTMGVAAGDLLGEGRIDLYLSNMFSKAGQRVIGNLPEGAYSPELMEKMRRWVSGGVVLANRGAGQFEEAPSDSVAAVGWAYGPALIDLDADGLHDLHVTAGFASFARDEPDG